MPNPPPTIPDVDTGLGEEAAAQIRSRVGPNAIPEPTRPGIAARVLAQLRDPMILLLLGAAALTVVLRDVTDFVVIAIVVVLNTAVGVAQEVRAERALEALKQLTAPMARVVREGHLRLRPAVDLVPGDIVRLEAGDIVPADLRLLWASHLQVNEAALTGESVPVDKDAGAESDVAYAGTVVTRGRAAGVATETGPSSSMGRIAQLLAEQKPRPTPLQIRLAALGRTLAAIAVVLSALVAVSGLLRGQPLDQMVLTAVSLSVAAVPESLPAVVTLALALGARRMAHRAAVVRSLPAVETLGSVTVIAADKTGTLTEGRMVAERVWTPGGEFQATGAGYDPHGTLEPANGGPSPHLQELLRDVVLCNDAALRAPEGEDTTWQPMGDPTEAALLVLAGKGGVDAPSMRSAYRRVAEIPFDSTRKRMTTVHTTAQPGQWLIVCKGAPEVLFGSAGLLAEAPYVAQARHAATRLSQDGYRVLAVSDRVTDHSDPALAERELRLVGLVAINDPPRHNAPDVVRSVRDAGVDLLLITGDHPQTARALAERVGLDGGHAGVVTGRDLEGGLPPAQVTSARVYARIRPEQKLDIVRAWQDRGHVVAMTGDGVNDGPALSRADIGVAMGRDGTEVARQAADIVLTNDDLGTVVAAIGEGRRIYANVRTFLRYGLSGGLAEVFVMLTGPLFGLAVPLLPAQILWINMLTHGLPGVALGAEPAEPEAMRKRPRSPDEFVLGGGLWRQIAWTGLLIGLVTLGAGWWAYSAGRPWQTMTFLTLGLAQLGVALALRRRGHRLLRLRFLDVAVAGAVALQLAGVFVPPIRTLLGTEPVTGRELVVSALAALIPGFVVALVRAARRAR